MSEPDVIQIVVTAAFRRQLEEWLASRDLCLFRITADEDDLPTYGIGIITETFPERAP